MCGSLSKLATLFEGRITTEKKNTPCIRIRLIIMPKSIYRISHEKNRIEIEKNGDKYEKALYKLMCNTVYGKNMEILRNRTDVRLLSKK